MPALLTVIAGALAAIAIVQNGDLALYLGNYRSTVIVHLVGLVSLTLWLIIRRERFRLDPATPWYGYTGGILGVFTVLGCNLTFASLGVSVSVALMLLGQTVFGAAVDQFGLFGVTRRPFQKAHLLSFTLIVAGIVVMLCV